MKKSLIAVGLLAAAIVFPAGYFGQVAEGTLKDRLANMPNGFRMEVTDYRRGWFSSKARLEWRPLHGLPFPGAIPPDMPLPGLIAVDLEIAHGPVYFAVGPGVGLFHARGRVALGAEASADTIYSPDSPASDLVVYLSSFSGRTVHNRIEARSLRADLGAVSLELEGFLAEGEWAGPNAFQLQNAALENMEMTFGVAAESARVTIAELQGQIEYPRGFESGAILVDSESVYSIGEIRVEMADSNTVMRMAGLKSLGTSTLSDEGLFGVEGSASIEALDFMGREFGPIRLTQRAGGFSEDVLLQLADALSGAMPEAVPAGAPEGPAQAEEESDRPALPQPTPELLDAFRSLLAGSPYAELDVVLTYAGEHTVALTLQLAFDGEQFPGTADGLNSASFLAGADCFLHFEIPVAAAEELLGQALLGPGLALGLLQQTDEDYVLVMSLREGAFELNGRAMPLPVQSPAPVIATEPAPLG